MLNNSGESVETRLVEVLPVLLGALVQLAFWTFD
jgi:hypothetical protein